jgi:hypothetical protein
LFLLEESRRLRGVAGRERSLTGFGTSVTGPCLARFVALESTMTNATVAETMARVDGHALTLKYRDGEKTIMVPAETPIVLYVPGDRSELKSGAKIYIPSATKQPDGTLQTARISVGRNGLTPPM